MFELVRKRHDGDGWIVFSELGNKAGIYANRFADAVALGVWASKKYEAHLYEFKVSREDVKRELRDPTKAEGVGRFCHYWWLTISDEKIIEGLVVPATWGILTPTKRGGSTILRVVRKAPKLTPKPFNEQFSVAAIRNIRAGYVENHVHQAALEEIHRLKHGPPPTEEEIEQRRTKADLELELDGLKKKIAAFERTSGVSIDNLGHWEAGKIGEAVRFVREHPNILEPSAILRRAKIMSEVAQSFEAEAEAVALLAIELRAMVPPTPHSEGCVNASKWGRSCTCGAAPVSEVERKLAGDAPRCDACAPEFGCFDGSKPCSKAPPVVADGDDHQGSGVDRGSAGAPEQDAGLLLRD